ncbi:phosphotransferase [Alicyclobacillus sp. SO9]|uniref:phosphotransferase n=1 Tax=Alicyclobacillus sp. SO9 TaxID=2665646 RepID=UPI0018E7509F|nr:phosphotransferase [Alicyclobacillus sp. SO9]QQE79939.1 hypothetical protein GI364_05515 [Alicyclobacillus sp. SO9]
MEALHHTELERMRPVLERYGLVGTAVCPVTSNRPDCTAYRIHTTAGDVFLKEIPKQQVGLLSLEHRLQQLYTCSYTAMPRYHKTPAERFVTVFGSKKYIVADWVDGTAISLVRTAENYQELGRNLARLHQVPNPAGRKLNSANEVRALSLMSDEGRELVRNSRTHQIFVNAVMNPVLTHSALSDTNVIVAGGKVVLVNWHRVQPGCSYSELATALIRTADCNTDAMGWLLAGYEEVKPLLQPERQLIFGFFSFPQKRRHIMRRVERTTVQRGSFDHHPDTARFAQATDWLRSWSGW